MHRLFACPRGHQWEAHDNGEGGCVATPLVCPVCGDPTPNATTVAAPDSLPGTITAALVTSEPAGTEYIRPGQRLAQPGAGGPVPRADGPPPDDSCTLPPSAASKAERLPAPAAAGPRVVVPGYEILQELGKGGMGVVYEARHIELDRIVALKMIRGGACADASDLARFHTEAEAVARLQHPGVVQIYETGQHDGLPYLSLEYCSGGSLDRHLRGTPLPAREAARIVELVAQAVHAAHVNQIVHRDLKPANILLAPALANSRLLRAHTAAASMLQATAEHGPRTTDFLPKVTDFGIAKKLDDVCGQTARGSILGTPSYMAPEQVTDGAAGVGPAVDIYALGAILYECLTGRPPFKAASALETTMQVVQDEPVPPSKLQSCTPRDLETICLKCLQKAPAKRYASALDLAEDLRRFHDGEPIRARPIGVLERARRWCGRHPLAPVSIAVLVLTAALWCGVRIERNQLRTIGRDTVPSIIAADDIKASLTDMHRYAAEQLLSDAGADAAAAYEQRRLHATEAILDAAANITFGEAERGPLRQLIHVLGTYEQTIARAITLRAKGDAAYLQAHREADRLMHSSLLKSAHALNLANREVLDRGYASQSGASALAIVCVVLGAIGLLTALASALGFSDAIHRRAALYASMVLAGLLLMAAVGAFLYADVCLHRARADAFESIHALQQARAEAFDLHGELCRTLLDASHAAVHEQEFTKKAATVLKLPPTLSRDQLAQALSAGQTPEGLIGLLADALRNVTFAGERESAALSIERFADYLHAAEHVRRLAAGGKPKDAVALCLGREPGQATRALAEFDAALGQTIRINRDEFDGTIGKGFETLALIDIANPLAALVIIGLAYVAVRTGPRPSGG